MEADESRRGKDPAALSGGHLCHVCGYQYPNPHPSAKLRRSHRKHCKAPLPAAAAAGEAVAEVVEEAVAGVAVGVPEREREEAGAGARNAAERTPLGGEGGGQRDENQEIGAREANGGGAAVRGSAVGDDGSAEDKVTAEHASPGTGAQVMATELSEHNCLINYSNNESASAEDTGTQTITSELSQNGLVNLSSKSIENVNEGNGTESQIACTNGSQTKVEHPAEREDSFDDYQDASPFLHQLDSEDGAATGSVFSTEINNLITVSPESNIAANENSVETNRLCKVQFPGEPNMRDLSSDSNVGYNLEDGALRLAEPHVKLGSPYEHSVNVENTYTDMVNSEPDETGHSEMIGHLNASSLQEPLPPFLEPESEFTNSGKVEDFMEDGLHVSHTMSEALPRPDTVQLETITNPGTNAMTIGSDLKVVCTDDAPIDRSTELPTQNSNVEDISDDHQPVENSCNKSLQCPTAAFQYDLPVTNVDGIPITNVNDLEFSFEERQERPLPNIIEENPSLEKTNGFAKENVHNKQIDHGIRAEDQFSTSQKHAALLTDQASSVKNPFNVDDDRNDDLFELPTDSCYLEVPNSVELRPQVDSTSLMVDQPTVSNLTRMAEAQQWHNSNECILSTSSAVENGEVIGLEDMPVSTSPELVGNTCSIDHSLQEGHKNGVIFVPSQATPSTVAMQAISAVSAEVEENMQAKDASAMEMTAVRSIDDIVTEQATSTTDENGYAAKVEEKEPIEVSAADMNEVQHLDHVDEEQAGSTELSSVQSMGNLEENKQTGDTDAKEMNAQFSGDDVEGKMQKTDGTSVEKMNAGGTDDSEVKMLAQDTTAKEVTAEQSTDNDEEKLQLQQPNGIVGEEGNSTKQNEEIAAPGTRLNSGRVRVPLKVLLAEASAENQVKKPSTKERVLSFGRRVSKDGNSGSDDHHWSSPAKLQHKDVDKSSKGRKQPWMPFICCHSAVH